MIKLLRRMFRLTPVDRLSQIKEWREAYEAIHEARAKHRKVKPHYNAMRDALHKDMGLSK